MNTIYLLRGPSFPPTSPPTSANPTWFLAQPSHSLFPSPLYPGLLQMLCAGSHARLIPSRPAVPTLYRAAAWALVWSAVMSSSGLPSFRAGLGPRTCRARQDYWGFCIQISQVTTCGPPVSRTVQGKAMVPAHPPNSLLPQGSTLYPSPEHKGAP